MDIRFSQLQTRFGPRILLSRAYDVRRLNRLSAVFRSLDVAIKDAKKDRNRFYVGVVIGVVGIVVGARASLLQNSDKNRF